MKKKLLIVTSSFPPLDSIASKRWGEMCETLKQDFDIYVFTQRSEGSLNTSISKQNIKRVNQIENKNYRKLAKNEITGRNIFKKINILKGLRTLDSTVYTLYIKNRREFRKYLKSINPDVIITSAGPFSTTFFGIEAKFLDKNIKWIVDLRDSMSLYNLDEKNWLKRKLDLYIDKHIIKRADLILTVSTHLSELFNSFYGKKVVTIYNGFNSTEIVKNQIDDYSIYYAGQVYIHQLPSLKLLIDVLKDNPDFKFVLRLVGTAKSRMDAIELIDEAELDNIEIKEPAPKNTINSEMANAGNLLVLEDLSEKSIISKGTLTGKLFDYLPYNGRIIAICRRDSEIGEILDKTGRGELVSNIYELESNLSNRGDAKLTSKIKIDSYSRSAQANLLTKVILNELFLEK